MPEIISRVVMPLVVAGVWTSLGVRALVTGDAVSPGALLACLAFTVAGTGLGIAGFTLLGRRVTRRHRPDPPPAFDPAVPPMFFVLAGLAAIGTGAGDGLFGSAGVLELLGLAGLSVAGGLLFGAAVSLHGLRSRASVGEGHVPTTP